MSYLLTEIALEMLGYKFYDIDGNFGPTNFQNSFHLSNSNYINDNIKEESLSVILNLIQTVNGEAGAENTANNSADLDTDPLEKASTRIDIDSSSNVADTTSPSQLKETTLQALPNVKRTLPNALSKLLDNECERIRNQILRNKNVFVQTNADIIKMSDQRGTASDCLTPFKEQEKIDLDTELQTMHMFRKMVERSLFKVRSDSYEKYKRIFVPSTEDPTPIVIDNN